MPRARNRASQVARESRAYQTMARKLGLRARQLREERELTLEAVAERASMDWKHWAKAEAGTLNLTLVTLWRIAKGLRVHLHELFLDVD